VAINSVDVILFHLESNIIVFVTDIITSDIHVRMRYSSVIWNVYGFCRGGDLIYSCGECRYFINYIHWTLDVGRACVSNRRDVSRHARHEGNRMPPPLRSLSSPFSLSLLEYLVRWMTTLDIQVDMPVPGRQEWHTAKMTRVFEIGSDAIPCSLDI